MNRARVVAYSTVAKKVDKTVLPPGIPPPEMHAGGLHLGAAEPGSISEEPINVLTGQLNAPGFRMGRSPRRL